MKLSQKTKAILTNFSQISDQMYFREGNELRAGDAANPSILAIANIEETIPLDFGIYDLRSLLNVISLFKDPEIEFGEHSLSIKEGNSAIRYYYTAPSLVVQVPTGTPKKSGYLVEFQMPKDVIQSVLKAASVMSLPTITFRNHDNRVVVVARDEATASSNEHVTVLGEYAGGVDFEANFKAASFKLVADDYDVTLIFKQTADEVMVAGAFDGKAVKYFMTSAKSSTIGAEAFASE